VWCDEQEAGEAAAKSRLRSRAWFDTPSNPNMTALYTGRCLNYGSTRERLQSGKRIIEIAQAGDIGFGGFVDLVASSEPSVGYCNTMGTASTMKNLSAGKPIDPPASGALFGIRLDKPGATVPKFTWPYRVYAPSQGAIELLVGTGRG
jgi:dihydroxyacid dehydratase/phosphogluconate dehydratase